jgi:hypothetical protein
MQNNNQAQKKLYILIPIDLLKLKKNNSFNFFNIDKFALINYLIIIATSLLYIYLIVNFLTTKYNSTLIKTFHLFIILISTVFLIINSIV